MFNKTAPACCVIADPIMKGFLIEDFINTDKVIAQSIESIVLLDKDRQLLQSISANNIDYAYDHFGIDRFAKEYQDLFQKARTSMLLS